MVNHKWYILPGILIAFIGFRCGQIKPLDSAQENNTEMENSSEIENTTEIENDTELKNNPEIENDTELKNSSEIDNKVNMNLSLVFFQPWNEAHPLNITKDNNQGGFLQVGPKTITLRRPPVTLKSLDGRLVAYRFDAPDKYLWEGEQTVASEPYSAEDHKLGRFDQVLLANEGKVLALASGQDLYVQKGEERIRELRLRGIAYNASDGNLSLGVRDGESTRVFSSSSGASGTSNNSGNSSTSANSGNSTTTTCKTGPEIPGKGPWTLYSHTDNSPILIANHQVLQRFNPDGTYLSKASLTDEVYEQELFPRAWKIESVAAESLDQVLISFTGPDGFGIGRLGF